MMTTIHDNKFSMPSLANSVTVALLIIPFGVYIYFIIRHMVNIPFDDDYDVIISFMNNFVQAHTLGDKWALLWRQHNEHRVVVERLIVLFQYYAFGEINISYLVLLGNLGWICVVAVFMIYMHKWNSLPLLHLVPIPYILLSFTHWDIMYFATSALANYWAVLFFISCMICLAHNKLFGGSGFFLAAVCTLANGVLLCFVGGLFLFRQRNWIKFSAFSIVAATVIVYYFHDYQKPIHHPDIFQPLLHPEEILTYIVLFWGNSFRLKYVALFLGTGMLVGSFYFFFSRKDNLLLKMFILFTLLTSIAAAFARGGFGVEQALSSRYSLYSLFICSAFYVFILTHPQTRIRSKTIAVIFSVLSLVFWGTFIIRYEYSQSFSIEKNKRIAAMTRFVNGDDSALNYHDSVRAAQMLRTADSLFLYNYADVLHRIRLDKSNPHISD